MEFQSIAIGEIGMSLNDFLDITPLEFKSIFDHFNKHRLQSFDYTQRAVYMGFGQANGGKKFVSVFKHKEEEVKKIVTLEQKMKDLEDIQNRLKRGG